MLEDYLFVEKYRPRRVADTILPCDLKNTFQGFVNSGNIPNLTLSGNAGVGKCLEYNTTVYIECDEDFLQKLHEMGIKYSFKR